MTYSYIKIILPGLLNFFLRWQGKTLKIISTATEKWPKTLDRWMCDKKKEIKSKWCRDGLELIQPAAYHPSIYQRQMRKIKKKSKLIAKISTTDARLLPASELSYGGKSRQEKKWLIFDSCWFQARVVVTRRTGNRSGKLGSVHTNGEWKLETEVMRVVLLASLCVLFDRFIQYLPSLRWSISLMSSRYAQISAPTWRRDRLYCVR